MSEPSWKKISYWKPDLISFKETLDGGQAFRWSPEKTENTYVGIFGNQLFRLKWKAPNSVFWSTPATNNKQSAEILRNYLGTDKLYSKYYDMLPWRSDAHLKQCMDDFPQMRILSQPASETLLCFLCSATKQIKQIKECTGLMAGNFGTEFLLGHHALPTWEQLSEIPEDALRECKLGFRAKNIRNTALKITEEPAFIETVKKLPYLEAKTKLCTLPGVGEKIADCTLLFGFNKLEAFPVDTWIIKAIARNYKLEAWTPSQISQFGRTHFGSLAGLAQQFLFSWERANK